MNLHKNSEPHYEQNIIMQRMINDFPDDAVSSENVITSLDAVESIFTSFMSKIKTTTKRRRNEIS